MTPFAEHRRRIAELRRIAQPAQPSVEQQTDPAPPPEPEPVAEPEDHEHG